MAGASRALLACAVLLLARGAAAQEPGDDELWLEIETPEQGAVVGDPAGMAFIAGRALAHRGELQTFDIVFVVDQSRSTMAPSGGDVNADGEVGDWECGPLPGPLATVAAVAGVCGEPRDSVLAAELLAVRTLLQQLDPRTTRVGVVAFSGDHVPSTPDATLIAPLTAEYRRVERALDELRLQGPTGSTNMQAGVQVATLALTHGAEGEPRPGARKVMLFLSDGQPNLPSDSLGSSRRAAVEAAVQAGRLDVRIDTFGIGEDALSQPSVLIEMARLTQGTFTPVREAGDLQSIFENADFSEIAELRVTNRTNGARPQDSLRSADGSFAALVPMEPGANSVEVYARSSDGVERTRTLTLEFLSQAQGPALSPEQRAQRNRLLENRLSALRERNLEVQAERDEELRRELQIRIQQERERRLRIDQERASPGTPAP
jgi:Mg-chelatase subunit ChlD